MRILIVSGLPWNNGNSFGSTYSSFLEGIPEWEYANIYCGYGEPDNNVKCISFPITEITLLKKMLHTANKETVCGQKGPESKSNSGTGESRLIDKLRKYNGRLMFWMRCLIWRLGKWKTAELENFVREFNPDIIFSPLYYNPYINRITLWAQRITNKPLALFVSDDIYSLHQFSLSPFFWIERLIIRINIRRTVQKCDCLYTISQIQQEEYQRIFNKKCKVLTKGADFGGREVLKKEYNKPLNLVYTGAVYGGRWRELYRIGKALQSLNSEEVKARLYIYTQSTLSPKIRKKLSIRDCVFLMGGVSGKQVPFIQQEADILVHVESQKLSEKLKVRHSFSTKLVDYFKSGRCILAVGPKDIASIAYLLKYKCGLVASSENEIAEILYKACEDRRILDRTAIAAWQCGKENHQIDVLQKGLAKDFEKLVTGKKNEYCSNKLCKL